MLQDQPSDRRGGHELLEKKTYDKWVAGLLFVKKWMLAEDVAEEKRQMREWRAMMLEIRATNGRRGGKGGATATAEEVVGRGGGGAMWPSIDDLDYAKTEMEDTGVDFKRLEAIEDVVMCVHGHIGGKKTLTDT